jgi:hypothetical protein
MGRRPRRAQRPLCGRAPVSKEAAGQGCRPACGETRRRGAPWSVSARTSSRRMSDPQRAGAPVKARVEGTPGKLDAPAVATRQGAGPATGTRPRGRGKRGLRSAWTNGEEAGSLVTGHPLVSGRTSKGQWTLGGMSERVGENRHGRAGNRANPRTGCGVQQTREAVCGASRRSREERQGRNTFGCGNPEPRATERGRTR